jgi:MoxR-like ATPase
VLAAVSGRDHVLPDDVKKLALPVFSHRMILRGGQGLGGVKVRDMLTGVLRSVPAPTEDPSARD